MKTDVRVLPVLLLAVILTSCSGGGGGSNSGGPSGYTVTGTVSGLWGTVVLQNNGADPLTLGADGSFKFSAALADGAAYTVTVRTQPATQICSVVNGTGTISGKNVTNVTVTCGDAVTVGGIITGLSGTVVLQNNGTDTLVLGSNGSFTFPTPLADMTTYHVTVQTQPANQTCSIVYGSGVTSVTHNITNIIITCSEFTYTVGGMVSGLSGTVVLQNNGEDILAIASAGTYTFPILYADGTIYNVTVQENPTSQICSAATGTGVIASANVAAVNVTCEAALGWDAPISDIDGSPITDVAGYRLYYGLESGMYSGFIDAGNSTRLAMATLSSTLTPGTYYVAVAGYDSDGVEGPLSNEITVPIP